MKTGKIPDINRILRNKQYNATSRYGARMGRRDVCDDWDDSEIKSLYLQRIKPVDYDYDAGGAYWGFGIGSTPLYCLFSEDGSVMMFARHADCNAALNHFADELPYGAKWTITLGTSGMTTFSNTDFAA